MAHLTERLGVQRLCIVHCLIARSVSIALPTKESQPWLSRIDNRQALAWHATLLLKQPIGKFVLLRVLLRTQKHLGQGAVTCHGANCYLWGIFRNPKT